MTHRVIVFFLAMIAVFNTVGCVTTPSTFQKALKADKKSQFFIEQIKALKTKELYNIALHFYIERDYTAYMTCAAQLLPRSTKAAWQPLHLYRDYPYYPATWAEVTARILTHRALMYIELGNLRAAKEDTKNAVAALEMCVDPDLDGQELAASELTEMAVAVELKPKNNARSVVWRFHYVEANYAHGIVMARSGDRDQALAAARKIDSQHVFALATVMNRIKKAFIMKIHLALGDYEEVKEALSRHAGIHASEYLNAGAVIAGACAAAVGGDIFLAIETLKGAVGAVNIRTSEFLLNNFCAAKVAFETGDIETARAGYDTLLEKKELKQLSGLHFVILHDRGQIAEQEGNINQALAFFQQAVKVIEAQRSTIHLEASKIGFVGDKQVVYKDTIRLLFRQERFEEAFSYAERSKARALIDLLASKKKFTGGSRENATKLTTMLREMETIQRASTKAFLNSPEECESKNRSIAVIQKQLRIADPELSSLVTVTPPSVKKIQALLEPNETLIEYYNHEEDLFAFLVTRNAIAGVKLSIENLNAQIVSLRHEITTPPDTTRSIGVKNTPKAHHASFKTKSRLLYKHLFRPLERRLKTKNLTIVPHGPLHYLPFTVLYDGTQYLVEQYNIRCLPSASVIEHLKKRKAPPNSHLLAFGNPDLNNPAYDLPGAEAETIAISRMIPDATVFTRGRATETAAKSLCRQYRYIHFALHGTFDAEHPLNSGLLMAPDNQNDGILKVGELFDLSMPADLVTLSACETALGKVSNGDDVIGFTRGFLYAGTQSIVSSLWKVDDQATSILMQTFYRNLAKTNKRNALCDAQRHVKNTYRDHPFYWAAFQLTGAVE